MNLPEDVLKLIFLYNRNCAQLNENHLVSKLWYKLLKEDFINCQKQIIFGKPICYYHYKDILNKFYGGLAMTLF